MPIQRNIVHAVESSSLADILERVLDKGIVIAGDIKVKLVDIELLTIQIRLVICSVDKAVEMGMNWWVTEPGLRSQPQPDRDKEIEALQERVLHLENAIPTSPQETGMKVSL